MVEKNYENNKQTHFLQSDIMNNSYQVISKLSTIVENLKSSIDSLESLNKSHELSSSILTNQTVFDVLPESAVLHKISDFKTIIEPQLNSDIHILNELLNTYKDKRDRLLREQTNNI